MMSNYDDYLQDNAPGVNDDEFLLELDEERNKWALEQLNKIRKHNPLK